MKAVIAVTLPSDGIPLVQLLRALQQVKMCAPVHWQWRKNSREYDRIRVANDVYLDGTGDMKPRWQSHHALESASVL